MQSAFPSFVATAKHGRPTSSTCFPQHFSLIDSTALSAPASFPTTRRELCPSWTFGVVRSPKKSASPWSCRLHGSFYLLHLSQSGSFADFDLSSQHLRQPDRRLLILQFLPLSKPTIPASNDNLSRKDSMGTQPLIQSSGHRDILGNQANPAFLPSRPLLHSVSQNFHHHAIPDVHLIPGSRARI
jgi:hypothetical protein